MDGFIFFDYRDLINSLDRYQVEAMTAELEGTLVWPITDPLEEMGIFEWEEGEAPDYPWIKDNSEEVPVPDASAENTEDVVFTPDNLPNDADKDPAKDLWAER